MFILINYRQIHEQCAGLRKQERDLASCAINKKCLRYKIIKEEFTFYCNFIYGYVVVFI